MVDKALSDLTDAGSTDTGDIAYIVRGGNSRRVALGSDLATIRADISALQGSTLTVANRTALKAVDTSDVTSVVLKEDGREGAFIWKSGDFSTHITNDPNEGVYVKADDTVSSSGAWVRVMERPGVYNVKWFGAVGDNATNDYAAIQAAIDFVEFYAGGTVFFPKGGFVCNTGLVIDTPLVRLEGAGCRYCSIRTASTTISLITISAARCAVTNLSLFQQALVSSQGAIVVLAGGCVQTTLSDLDMVGGFYCIEVDTTVANILIDNIVARQAIGGAIIYCRGGAVIIRECALNQDWPVAVPNVDGSNDKGARANATGYSVNDFVTLSGKLLQCKTAGTSGGSAPTILYFGNDITDGTVTWQLAGNSDGAALYIDSDASYVTAHDTDMTGSYVYGVRQENGLGTTAPTMTRVFNCTIGGTIDYGIKVAAAGRIYIEGNELQSPVGGGTGVIGIDFGSGVVGDLYVRGNSLVAGWDTGINLAYSTSFGSALVAHNEVFGATVAIHVGAAVKDFQIIGNNVGVSSQWGANGKAIDVDTGASDYYIIADNRVRGYSTSGVDDDGTGVNKSLTGNI